jgi:hypothetical protein
MGSRTIQLESLTESISDDPATPVIFVAQFLISQMILKPDGAFYAKWDAEKNEAIWYYSADHTAIFAWPEQKEPILRQTSRGTFRSVIFRIGCHAAKEHDYVPLSGFYFLQYVKDGRPIRKRIMIHSDFFPEFGVWIKATFLTVNDEPNDAEQPTQPTFVEIN